MEFSSILTWPKQSWEILHLVGFNYKNISRCTVLWMANAWFWQSLRQDICELNASKVHIIFRKWLQFPTYQLQQLPQAFTILGGEKKHHVLWWNVISTHGEEHIHNCEFWQETTHEKIKHIRDSPKIDAWAECSLVKMLDIPSAQRKRSIASVTWTCSNNLHSPKRREARGPSFWNKMVLHVILITEFSAAEWNISLSVILQGWPSSMDTILLDLKHWIFLF